MKTRTVITALACFIALAFIMYSRWRSAELNRANCENIFLAAKEIYSHELSSSFSSATGVAPSDVAMRSFSDPKATKLSPVSHGRYRVAWAGVDIAFAKENQGGQPFALVFNDASLRQGCAVGIYFGGDCQYLDEGPVKSALPLFGLPAGSAGQ